MPVRQIVAGQIAKLYDIVNGRTHWERFFREKVTKLFFEKKSVLDIGGGLRIRRDSGSRYDALRAWMLPLVESVEYKIMDPVPDFNPDILGDIHEIPLADNSQDAIVCMAVLEHVHDRFRACREMHRVLKPGGYCLAYLPFLFTYHAEPGYYSDYWRFTEEGARALFKPFSSLEIRNRIGQIETLVRLSPLERFPSGLVLAGALDRMMRKDLTRRTAGYLVFAVK